MKSVEQDPDERLLKAALRLNSRSLALFLGLLCGLGLFVATNWLIIKGGPMGADGEPVVGPTLSLLGQYFIGYEVTFVGSLVGFVWAFGVGALVGWLTGLCYNWIVATSDAR